MRSKRKVERGPTRRLIPKTVCARKTLEGRAGYGGRTLVEARASPGAPAAPSGLSGPPPMAEAKSEVGPVGGHLQSRARASIQASKDIYGRGLGLLRLEQPATDGYLATNKNEHCTARSPFGKRGQWQIQDQGYIIPSSSHLRAYERACYLGLPACSNLVVYSRKQKSNQPALRVDKCGSSQ